MKKKLNQTKKNLFFVHFVKIFQFLALPTKIIFPFSFDFPSHQHTSIFRSLIDHKKKSIAFHFNSSLQIIIDNNNFCDLENHHSNSYQTKNPPQN